MPGGWGGYQKPKKSKQQVALERRRELGNKFFTPIDELISLAATARVKVKRLPYVPPEDPVASPSIDPGAPITGPCQAHVEYFRSWREAGRPRGRVAAPEPSAPRLLSYGSRGKRRLSPEETTVTGTDCSAPTKPVKRAKSRVDTPMKTKGWRQRLRCATHGYEGNPGNMGRHCKKHVGCVIETVR